ncbi:hypothetical protein AB0E83_34275 [Streptomyces sp. NPDC035033]|uniref:hypothetical protein n=1 Tax=Streptomyces sp. NPDC035033 TaxID=3155368 RepID=UPI0033FCE9CE
MTGQTLVLVDEHPLRGPAARWHNTAADALLRWRHRRMLDRLEQVAVAERDRSLAGAPGGPRPPSGDDGGGRDRGRS